MIINTGLLLWGGMKVKFTNACRVAEMFGCKALSMGKLLLLILTGADHSFTTATSRCTFYSQYRCSSHLHCPDPICVVGYTEIAENIPCPELPLHWFTVCFPEFPCTRVQEGAMKKKKKENHRTIQPQNILSWNGATRIAVSNSWLYKGPPKIQTLCQSALSKCSLNSSSLGP